MEIITEQPRARPSLTVLQWDWSRAPVRTSTRRPLQAFLEGTQATRLWVPVTTLHLQNWLCYHRSPSTGSLLKCPQLQSYSRQCQELGTPAGSYAAWVARASASESSWAACRDASARSWIKSRIPGTENQHSVMWPPQVGTDPPATRQDVLPFNCKVIDVLCGK